jgi:predicted enzyme related to lactoylglutathione lyase
MDHTIVHFEIPANDTEKIKKFYEGVFGWKITKAPFQGQEYWLIETVPIDEKGAPIRPGINGGMYPRSPQWKEAKPVNYFTVENIDE